MIASAFFAVILFIAASALLVLSARSDWRGLTIPNEYSLALIGLFLLGVLIPNTLFSGVKFVPGLIAGAVVFFITMLLYASKAMGAGDTKLAGATALLVGVGDIDIFLLVMALTGGVLAVYAILTRKHGDKLLPRTPVPGTWLAALKEGQNKVPYGIAIAAGGIAALADKWLLSLIH